MKAHSKDAGHSGCAESRFQTKILMTAIFTLMTVCPHVSASFQACKITAERTWISFSYFGSSWKKSISVSGRSGPQAPDTKSQLLPSCSRLIEILPWPDPSTEQNGIYSQSKANQRKRTKVYRQPELLRSKEVSDVWVNNVLLLQRALDADCLGSTLPWWKALTLWLMKGQDLDSGVFIWKPQIQTK